MCAFPISLFPQYILSKVFFPLPLSPLPFHDVPAARRFLRATLLKSFSERKKKKKKKPNDLENGKMHLQWGVYGEPNSFSFFFFPRFHPYIRGRNTDTHSLTLFIYLACIFRRWFIIFTCKCVYVRLADKMME